MLKAYIDAYSNRDKKGRLYIRILNGQELENEEARIRRIVKAWQQELPLREDDLDRINEVGDTKLKQKIHFDWSVQTTTSRKTRSRADIAYQELHEAIVEWEVGKKDRLRPRQCVECSDWFVSAPRGAIPQYCSRECDQKASNRRNSEPIKAKVREGRKKGDYQ